MKRALLKLLLTGGIGLLASSPWAATFTPIKQKRFGMWEASLYENNNTREQFCAAETKDKNNTVFRLNFYRNGTSFVEFFNPKWDIIKGEARFSMKFSGSYAVQLRGRSWGDSYTHDFTERKMVHVLLGLLVKEKGVQLLNANGAPIGDFSLSGSKEALLVLDDCVGGI